MAVEQRWFHEGTASPGDADGEICIVCKQQIIDDSQPAHWVYKAVEDNQDSDFVLEDGYAHFACNQKKLAAERKSSFELPPVPDFPGRSS